MKTDDFHVDLDMISMFDAIEAKQNVINREIYRK